MFENSPAFEHRGQARRKRVPQGRLMFVSAVPAGLGVFPTCPGIEMPGYFRLLLWSRKIFLDNSGWREIASGLWEKSSVKLKLRHELLNYE
jgi:hypothetical protein